MAEKIIIVDENDNEIGLRNRSEITPQDIYRAAGLWLTNTRGEILLARRGYNKKHNPGMWGPAVSGTVEEGETYESNIKKEIEEELSLTGLNLIKGPKELRRDDYTFFAQWFFGKLDISIGELRYNKDEIAELKWFTKEEILAALEKKSEEFLVGMKGWVETF